jgi:hypothetical protein
LAEADIEHLARLTVGQSIVLDRTINVMEHAKKFNQAAKEATAISQALIDKLTQLNQINIALLIGVEDEQRRYYLQK